MTLATIAFVNSWVVVHLALRGKKVDFRKAFTASLVLAGLGFALTFPPVVLLFAPV